jgi:DNA-binding beta-propeller fold protein YncE
MNPLMVAVDHQGNMYVTEGSALYSGTALASRRAEILKLSQTGRVLARWGRYGTRPGEFNEPAGIAVDSHGNVYVADFGNDRIQKLSSSGRVLAVWGSPGTSRGQFDLPLGLTVDSQDNVYVADYLNNRVQKLSPAGKVLALWGSSCGTAPRQFCNPFDVAVKSTGDIYVSDFGNNRLQRLSPAGNPRGTWPMPGYRPLSTAPHGPVCPTSIAIDAHGDVYVLRNDSSLVYKFSALGKLLSTWDVGARLSSPVTGLAFDPSGRLILVSGHQLYRVSPDGRSTASLPIETQPMPARFDQPSVIATGPHGIVYVVAGAAHDTIEGLSRSGRLLSMWRPRVPGRSTTYDLTGAAVDARGHVFLTDALNQRVVQLSAAGRELSRWGAANGSGQLVAPNGVALDARSRAYVADASSNQVDVFSPAGIPLAHWGYYGTGSGQFDDPRAVAVDPEGNVYIADTGNGRIQKLSPVGRPLAAWGADGTHSTRRFEDVTGLALDRAGDIYAVDALSNEVTEFSLSGAVLARWDGTDTGRGRFRQPQSIAIDDRGAVYVADTGNDRVVKLTR